MSSTPESGNGTKQVIPPYLSHKTFTNFIDGLRAGVPARIDRSVMSSLSGTAQAHLLHALRYLNLINAEGIPDEKLGQLAAAQDTEKQKLLREILTSAYPFVCSNSSIDLERCTGKQIEEAFATTGASSETLRKSLAFFLATAKQAGMKLSPHMKRTRRPRQTGQRGRGAARGGTQSAIAETPAQNPPPATTTQTGTTKTIQLKAGGSLTLSLAVNILELKGKDREFVFKLVDDLDAYEAGNSDQAVSE
jgi:hypothetical protein